MQGGKQDGDASMVQEGHEPEAPEANAAQASGAAAAGPAAGPSVDPAEIERFTALAERWWDRHGAFRALHALNPVRIAYVRDALVADSPPDAREDTSPLKPSPACGSSMSAAAAA